MTRLTNADGIQAYSGIPHDVIEAFGNQGDLIRQYLLNPALLALVGDVHGTAILDAVVARAISPGSSPGKVPMSLVSSHLMRFSDTVFNVNNASRLAFSISRPIFRPGSRHRICFTQE
jgi:hypothetical protein